MSMLREGDRGLDDPPPAEGKGLTIGAVCRLLKVDFPSISISKLRYLEDQRLVMPRRTEGGYRLYSPMDVERLRTILRLQRDEFLPLRVIRQELESSTSGAFSVANQARQLKRANITEPAPTRRYGVEEVLQTTGAARELVHQLEQYGLVSGRAGSYDETDREVVQTAVELAAYGVEPRHLRLFRVAAEREAALLEQVLAAGLRSKNPDRRHEALESLEGLAALASHLRHLMLVSELRRIINA
ncbi:MAG: MerR family transcriptional regulator [Thermoleophilia bacterium]|jgi:DNA-binding transcriptional MerR regulator|nr:MerR family transcriptional regulator [Thermoleophilia bacterium]